MPDDNDRAVRDSDRIWRLTQVVDDQRQRIDRLERRLEEQAQYVDRRFIDATAKADQAYFVAEVLRNRVDSMGVKQNRGNGGESKSILQDSAFVRGIIAVLITGLLAFATGRFFNIGG